MNASTPNKNSHDDMSSIVSSPETYDSFVSVNAGDRSLSTSTSEFPGLRSRAESIFSEGTTDLRRRDVALEKVLKDEPLPVAVEADANDASDTVANANPYHLWECGFGFSGKLEAPAAVPDTKSEFIKAVEGEIATADHIKNGLMSYNKAINSGEHHAFSEDFLKQQSLATTITIGQLVQISHHLQDVRKEVESIKDDTAKVHDEMKAAFRHAQPWIQRTRAILVSSHVFYKINYVLGNDKKTTTA